MGVKQLHTAVCKCDGCGVVKEVPIGYDATTIECLPAGWYLMNVSVMYRTDCGYEQAPQEQLALCSKACAGIAIRERLRHA